MSVDPHITLKLLRAAIVRSGGAWGPTSFRPDGESAEQDERLRRLVGDLFPGYRESPNDPVGLYLKLGGHLGELTLLDRVAPLGSLYVVAPVVSLLQRVRLPLTIFVPNAPPETDLIGVGLWVKGRASEEGVSRLVRLSVYPVEWPS